MTIEVRKTMFFVWTGLAATGIRSERLTPEEELGRDR